MEKINPPHICPHCNEGYYGAIYKDIFRTPADYTHKELCPSCKKTLLTREVKIEVKDFICPEPCNTCCAIYADDEHGGVYPSGQVWFDEWCNEFHYGNECYGVEPLFEPLETHMTGNEKLAEDLLKKGIDHHNCQYLGPNGCIIPREKRPVSCREYRCHKWKISECTKCGKKGTPGENIPIIGEKYYEVSACCNAIILFSNP